MKRASSVGQVAVSVSRVGIALDSQKRVGDIKNPPQTQRPIRGYTINLLCTVLYFPGFKVKT